MAVLSTGDPDSEIRPGCRGLDARLLSQNTVNVARAGLNHLHTTRVVPEANNLTNIPGNYGIQDIPQGPENGGLPEFGIKRTFNLGKPTTSCPRMKSLPLPSSRRSHQDLREAYL